jgi:beta-lactamase superfamily II metal-dependent hydrolase
MFELEMLPAREGDCLLLTYGHPDSPRRILIDGGRAVTYADIKTRLERLPEGQRDFELLVVTHVDRDHIEGVLAMLEDSVRPVRFRDIWFNGYHHLLDDSVESFGPRQGEKLSTAILKQRLPWNRAFNGRAVETRAGFPAVELDGDLKITVLSPSREKLEALIEKWVDDCAEAGLIPGSSSERRDLPDDEDAFGGFSIADASKEPFQKDTSRPNGSSIALLVEYEGRRLLLAGDAHADLLAESIRPLAREAGGRLPLDAFKLSHHGSAANTSSELLDLISCRNYLISTNGSIHGHPDKVALARVIRSGDAERELIFNYETPGTSFWNNSVWQNKHKYGTRYPLPGENGTVKLSF